VARLIKPFGAFVLVVYLIIQIVSLGIKDRKNPTLPARVVVFLASPAQHFVTRSLEWTGDVWSHYIALSDAKKENEILTTQVKALRREIMELEESAKENVRLRSLLELKERGDLELVPAERVAIGMSPYERTLRIRRGKKDGIKQEMAVVHSSGIVGQILKVYSGVSDVLLLVDSASAIDVIDQRSRARGILRGRSTNELEFIFLSKEDDFLKGDVLLATGLDGIYPKGLLVGVVSFVEKEPKGLFRTVRVQPHVDFRRIEEVAVVLSQTQDGIQE